MNGNITADGITRDLEAMRRIGVTGFQIFQAGTGITKGPVEYGSPEHFQLLQHAAKEAARLGLEFTMHNCPGWSSSGGPWITPEFSMLQLVWSETFIAGGELVENILPQPYTNLGFYRDTFVLAFPSLVGEKRPLRDLLSQIVSSSGSIDASLLFDGDPSSGIEVRPAGPGQPAFLQLKFAEPFEARSIAVTVAPLGAPFFFFRAMAPISLEASDDGVQFRKVCSINMALPGMGGRSAPPTTGSFPAVRARYFRLIFPEACRVSKLQLFWTTRIADWPIKANFLGQMVPFGLAPQPKETVEDPPGSVIDPNSVIDITEHMDEQGQLRWHAPPGDWTILRLGYTAIGTKNHPAPDNGEGLECDKYSREAFESHFSHFFGKLLPSLTQLSGKGLTGATIDSYEMGFQNWTPKFPQEFQRRRSYDLRKYLPAMTGRVVGSVNISERFLWDVLRTHADMMADNYYGRFAELCRENGMKSYAEPYAFGTGFGGAPFEEMQIGSRVDVPMGEFWVARDDGHERTVKLASSIAHLFGKPIAGAESFTGEPSASSWQEHPYLMKSLGDFMFTRGLNLIIFHTYAQQPHPSAKPGMTMGPFGCYINRNNTGWDQGKAWLDYQTHCQYMLQQGSFVGDLLYFVGEDAPLSVPHESQLDPPLPRGYDYDFVNAEAILTRLSVANDRIVTPDGLSYRALVLGDRTKITPTLLRKIRDMVEQGICLVVGSKPDRSPGLTGYPESDEEVRRIANELWSDLDGKTVTERAFGKGHVFRMQSLQAVLDRLGVKPDFEFTARSPDALINYIHRRIGDIDAYFVANRRRRSENLVCAFRVEGKQPELWDPETGMITPVVIYKMEDGRVRLPLRLGPNGSVFVVMRRPAPPRSLHAVEKDDKLLMGADPFPVPLAGLHPEVMNNFTIGVWVKPEVNASIPIDGGFFQPRSGACWVFYPPVGEAVYGQGHATCGLAAGRNGIAVYERDRGDPEPVLATPMPLEGWTYLVVVYKDGVPSLYVNGKLMCKGRKSNKVIHPGLGEPYQGESYLTHPTYSIGDTSEPELFTEALNGNRIQKLVTAGPPQPEEPSAIEFVDDERAGLLIWENGSYTLRDSDGQGLTLRISEIDRPTKVTGPWRVSFLPSTSAPPEVSLSELISLRKHSEDGLKYFSGTATYSTRFNFSSDVKVDGERLYLDLGWVETIAEVRLNGKDLGILWKPPYRMDVTDVVRTGDNDLEVRVTNVWVNRLIGDAQLPPEYEYASFDEGFGRMGGSIKKLPDWYVQGKPKPPGKQVAFVTWQHYHKDSPLLESGLIGPVQLRMAIRRTID